MEELITQYQNTRKHTATLCIPLNTEDYVPQAALFASPPKWHLAHTTWFFETMILVPYLEDYQIFHEDFSYLFNSYYNNVGERVDRGERGLITRPTVKEVYNYRSYVDQQMMELLAQNNNDKVTELTILGINHEQQHQELLLTDLKYALSRNPIHPVYASDQNRVNDTNAKEEWVVMDEGIYEIGFDGDGFHFDNEKGRHKVYLNDYTIANHLVTNGEFIAFIEAGGYADFNLWLDEGWAWVNEQQCTAPLYWKQHNGTWHYYTLAGLQPVNPDAILCHISYYEAAAFAAWKGMRLPTEQEWEAAHEHLNWGTRWEWTNSAYLPYPNFKTAEGAVGEYNGKFMINQMVLRGGSVATAKGHSRPTYRNFFHPHYQWQYTGIRLVQ